MRIVEEHTLAAEHEFDVEGSRILLMVASESSRGVMNTYGIVTASGRVFGCTIPGGSFRESTHMQIERDGIEMLTARGQILLTARVADV